MSFHSIMFVVTLICNKTFLALLENSKIFNYCFLSIYFIKYLLLIAVCVILIFMFIKGICVFVA